jgi:hypothetical protein
MNVHGVGVNHWLTDEPHAVYRPFDVDDSLIYVGCSSCPPDRMRIHRLRFGIG